MRHWSVVFKCLRYIYYKLLYASTVRGVRQNMTHHDPVDPHAQTALLSTSHVLLYCIGYAFNILNATVFPDVCYKL